MTQTTAYAIDLHTHSTASDGVLSPAKLLQAAIDRQVKTLAITDHDTVSGYLSVKDNARQRGVNLIAGVELSTLWSGIGVHIVGLNFDPNHSAMTTLLKAQTNARQRRTEVILKRLDNIGFSMDLDELSPHVGNGIIGRPHIAKLMVEKGYVENINKAFRKYLGSGKIGDVKSGWVNVSEGVNAIRDSGGVAVIAHPNHYKLTRSKLLRLVDEFQSAGGQGIEVISGKQHRDITNKIAQIANDKALYASLGSDFHRPLPYMPHVGELPPLPDDVQPIWQCFDAQTLR